MVAHAFSAEELLALIWAGPENGLIFYDAQGERVLANPTAQALLEPYRDGIAEQVIYLADGDSVAPQDAWPLHRALRGETIRGEQIVLRSEADPIGRRLMVSAYPITLPDGRPGALTMFFDVTQRSLSDQATRSTVEQLNLLLRGADGYAIVLTDGRGVVKSWGENASRLLGYTDADMVGQPFVRVFSPEARRNGVPERMIHEATTKGGTHFEGERIRKDGTRFWAYGVMTPIRDVNGEVVSLVAVIHDVSARYQAEQAVEELNTKLLRMNEDLEERVRERTALLEGRTAELVSVNTELAAFSYSVSHDLRAPVRAVQGYARIVRDRYAELMGDDGLALLARIEEQAQRMGDLVDSLLQLSRMQRQAMTRERVDMADLVHRCWQAICAGDPENRAELSVGPLPPAQGDPRLLHQVWMNLLENAVKYSKGRPDARVDVSSRAEADTVVYAVQDNGAGFDPRYSDKLFQAFQRLHREDEFPGIGIGLAIVHRVVLRHGGRVWADGAPGAGATFSFSLRRSSDEAA